MQMKITKQTLIRLGRRAGFWLSAGAMELATTTVWAQDADEKPIPLDPATAAAQVRIFEIIALIIAAAIGFYLFRRWQITRRGGGGDGGNQD